MSDAVIEATDTQNKTAGGLLSAARESLGFTQKDIADQLYLTPSFIELIDRDEGHKIQKQAFVKGYLRSYAKLVGLDGDVIVGLFDVTYVKPGKVDMRRVSTNSISPIHFTGPVFKTGIVGLLAIVLVVGTVWYFSADKKTNEQATVNTPVTMVNPIKQKDAETSSAQNEFERSETLQSDAALQSEAEQDGAANRADARDTLAIESGFAAELQASRLATEIENDSNVENGVVITREREDGVNYIYVDAGGIDRLKFVFTDECWLEVIDADGTKIFADLGVSGDEISMTGIAPFRLLFGNATVVRLSVNGEAFNLGRYTGSDQTAKVRVGT